MLRLFRAPLRSLLSSSIRNEVTHDGKIYASPKDAIHDMKDGDYVAMGGFGIVGIPENGVLAMVERKLKHIHIVSNIAGIGDWGIGLLLTDLQVDSMNASYVGENPIFEKQYLTGQIAFNMIPQGTLAERCRMAASGIAAEYVKAGVGTYVETGGFATKWGKDGKSVIEILQPKERRHFDRDYLLEKALDIDFSMIKCYQADKKGNLRFRKTARNFNPDMAGAARVTMAEAELIVDEIPADQIHFPGCFVDRIYKSPKVSKKIERRKFRLPEGVNHKEHNTKKEEPKAKGRDVVKDVIATRAVQELKPGMYCNLGIGIPNLVANHIIGKVDADLQSECGIVGIGPYPLEKDVDCDLINAGKETISEAKGFSHNRSSDAFGMMRGLHLHMTMLGGLQVSQSGDLANWIIPGAKVKGIGGAMDLVSCGSKVVVTMEHMNGKEFKVLKECKIPLTGKGVVSTLITEKAVFEFTKEGMVLTELGPDTNEEDVKRSTEAEYTVSPNLKKMEL